jgi:hypothetical protein
MEVNITGKLINRDRLASDLIEFLKQRVDALGLEVTFPPKTATP